MVPYIGLLKYSLDNFDDCLECISIHRFLKIAVALHNNDIGYNVEFPSIEHSTDIDVSDVIIDRQIWANYIITILPDYECDSTDKKLRERSEKALIADLATADRMVNRGDIMVRLRSGNNTNLARLIKSKLKGCCFVQVPLCQPSKQHDANRRDRNYSEERIYKEDTWEWWNAFRYVNQFHRSFKVVLELKDNEVPRINNIKRWLSEPVEAVIVPATIFIYDDKHSNHYLPLDWYEVISHFVRGKINILITAVENDYFLRDYRRYFTELQSFIHGGRKCEDDLKPEEKITFLCPELESGMPVKKIITPPSEELESDMAEEEITFPSQELESDMTESLYENLESDTKKYLLYSKAIEKALNDRVPSDLIEEKITFIIILGVGRGPLIDCVFYCMRKYGYRIKLLVVEKNENALRTLKHLMTTRWKEYYLSLVKQDFRACRPPKEKADIIISELFGSFGDNKLSPELLACAANFLKSDGICIPYKSTSFINPIMAPKILADQRAMCGKDREEDKDFVSMESNFEILMKNVYHIGKPKPVFKFEYPVKKLIHPNPNEKKNDENKDNEEIVETDYKDFEHATVEFKRFKIIKFLVKTSAIFNGLVGYFEASLYKNIKMSTNRINRTPGLTTWLPMYFPLTQPIEVKTGDTIEIHFWRRSNSYKVWYEYCIMKPVKTHIHNFQGHFSHVKF